MSLSYTGSNPVLTTKIKVMLELHDGSLSCGYTKVIYRGKEFPAPVDIVVLLAWDYVIHLLQTSNK